ncbi:acid resistance periplasmic serine protease MarP [Pilimelia terevasa]|uniref:Acid resistance periplasmic serine protease MarP n=1 Tax=Pilimelia terevasa TaxID=53372 RepID=A0A8J3BHK9_9ACTN|nr:MarP family serine protease [Pilimelia terevasa]GGK11694.1 acid resistance periplasmic serine protease MarP [Pilimelia terevasa]
MSPLDYLLILLMLAFAFSGYRQGFVTGALSFTGFFGGAVVGLQVGPWLANQVIDPTFKVTVALAAVFGLAVIGQAAAGILGTRLRKGIQHRYGRMADDIGGAGISLVAMVLVVWLVAVPLGVSSLPWVAAAVRTSKVLDGIDAVVPEPAKAMSQRLRQSVDTRGFPDVFEGLDATRVTEVAAPDPALARSVAVATGKRSMVKVLGNAPTCSRRIEGSGFVYAAERVMTNAHVVAGTERVRVELDGDRHDATVVVYDPGRDLAVLRVPGLRAPVLPFVRQAAETGQNAVVLGFPLDGPFNAQAARIRDLRQITGPDIYDDRRVTRQVYTIRALVRSGNSGGPLVTADSRVLGVIFAAAADDRNTGFAVSATEAAGVAEVGRTATDRTRTGRCA